MEFKTERESLHTVYTQRLIANAGKNHNQTYCIFCKQAWHTLKKVCNYSLCGWSSANYGYKNGTRHRCIFHSLLLTWFMQVSFRQCKVQSSLMPKLILLNTPPTAPLLLLSGIVTHQNTKLVQVKKNITAQQKNLTSQFDMWLLLVYFQV